MQPRQFTVYGMGPDDRVQFTESFEAPDLFAAHERARTRVRRFHRVEVWEGPVCILRMQRGALVS